VGMSRVPYNVENEEVFSSASKDSIAPLNAPYEEEILNAGSTSKETNHEVHEVSSSESRTLSDIKELSPKDKKSQMRKLRYEEIPVEDMDVKQMLKSVTFWLFAVK
jgi:hypothetical protein